MMIVVSSSGKLLTVVLKCCVVESVLLTHWRYVLSLLLLSL